MVRRENDMPEGVKDAAGFGLKRNPGVTLLWHTRGYEVFKVAEGNTGYLITMGEPESVAWYACGRPATREEAVESIDSGLPNLQAVARTEKGGMEALAKAQERFSKWLPSA
jgi:hypothetical protein